MDDAARTESGLPVRAVCGVGALDGFGPEAALGAPAGFPFTRGGPPAMDAGRPWTMRHYAGSGAAKESNERYHELVSAGIGQLIVLEFSFWSAPGSLRSCRRIAWLDWEGRALFRAGTADQPVSLTGTAWFGCGPGPPR